MRPHALWILAAALLFGAAPLHAQTRSVGLSLDALPTRAMSRQALRQGVAQNLHVQYAGDQTIQARLMMVVTTGTQSTNTWISDAITLTPGATVNTSDLPFPGPTEFPDGGIPAGSAASSWLPWPFCWFGGCDDDEAPPPETDGERKFRELEERERRQNDFNHLATHGLQSAPTGGASATTTVTLALVPIAEVAEEGGGTRVQTVTLHLRRGR